MALERVKEMLDQVGRAARVETVFGDSREIAGKTVIPVAKVAYGGGGGGGQGKDKDDQEGSGGGGGLGVRVTPMGALVVTEEAERWVPIVDTTKVILAGHLVALMALWTIKKIGTRRKD
jgi:uncharacterized spore protein YtfJ